jgi:predicted PurR-regulated permease PerM
MRPLFNTVFALATLRVKIYRPFNIESTSHANQPGGLSMDSTEREAAIWRFPVLLLVGGFFIYLLRDVLIPFSLAFILAYIFTPFVDLLERRLHIPRFLAVLLLLGALSVPVVAIFWYNGPLISQNIQHMTEDAPEQITRFLTNLFGGQKIAFLGQVLDVRVVAPYLIHQIQDLLGAPLGVAQVAWSFINIIMGAIFTFVIFIYFLAGGKGLIKGTLQLVSKQHRDRLQDLVQKIDSLIGRYLRGLAAIVVLTTFVVWIAFKFVFNIPYAFFLALVIGALEVIPLFGPIASGALTGIVALAQGNLIFFAKVMVFYLIMRFTNDQVVSPIVLGKAVTISPVVVLFAFLTGSTLFGFLGLLFAVPAASILKIVLDEQNAA